MINGLIKARISDNVLNESHHSIFELFISNGFVISVKTIHSGLYGWFVLGGMSLQKLSEWTMPDTHLVTFRELYCPRNNSWRDCWNTSDIIEALAT